MIKLSRNFAKVRHKLKACNFWIHRRRFNAVSKMRCLAAIRGSPLRARTRVTSMERRLRGHRRSLNWLRQRLSAIKCSTLPWPMRALASSAAARSWRPKKMKMLQLRMSTASTKFRKVWHRPRLKFKWTAWRIHLIRHTAWLELTQTVCSLVLVHSTSREQCCAKSVIWRKTEE